MKEKSTGHVLVWQSTQEGNIPEIPKIHGYIPTQGEPAEPLGFSKVGRDDPNRHIPNRLWLMWSPCGSDLLFIFLKCFLSKKKKITALKLGQRVVWGLCTSS